MRARTIEFIVNFNIRKILIKSLFALHIIKKRTLYQLNLVERGHYAFGLMRAANDCKALGYKGFTAIEFGVAGGNGLIALERHAINIEKFTGLEIEVFGLDSGTGMPPPKDFRDIPYLWQSGFYKMNIPLLKSRLTRSKLLIGPVKSTVRDLIKMVSTDKPIAFIAFDLDYYSSTMEAFLLFKASQKRFIPRVWCYFDDLPNVLPFAGENLAISDFNHKSKDKKLGKPGMLIHTIPFEPAWANQMYQLHILNHKRYSFNLNSGQQLPLKD